MKGHLKTEFKRYIYGICKNKTPVVSEPLQNCFCWISFSVVPVFAVYLLFTMDMKNIFTDILGTIIMMALIVFAAPLQTAFFIWFGHLISSKFMIFGIEYQKGTES